MIMRSGITRIVPRRWTISRSKKEASRGPVDDEQPGDESDEEEDLPDPSQFEKFPSLMSQPEPPVPQESLDPGDLPEEASAGHEKDGHE
jgi:hypothetical protein